MEEISYYELLKPTLADIEKDAKNYQMLFNLTLSHIEKLADGERTDEINEILKGEIRHFYLERELLNLLQFTKNHLGDIVKTLEKFLLENENFSELLSDRLADIFREREMKLAALRAEFKQIKKSC